MSGLRSRGRSDRGQTAIEFVGVTPLIILLLVALWQCALIGYTFVLAGNAADMGARAGSGAEGGSQAQKRACEQAAREDLPVAWTEGVGYACNGNEPGLYRATITLNVPVMVPGVLNFPFPVDGDAASVKEN
ncbi:TadE/TadG family type IV pilus assembly protein [Streptomyces sp. NPDC059134]|uniref:TadE/TadG family type IV pilus assembly protein n=1 Tax=Streptomyces sp. NPDC059134 TaxID=3346738 RepID=UPI0036B4B091